MKNMMTWGKYVFLLLSLGFVGSIAFARQGNVPEALLSGIYEYVYEHNTKDLIENHYLEFRNENGKIEGTYYGTSDDFDEAREGYLPGFFSARMKNLVVQGPSISFEIEITDADMFNEPVTPTNRTGKHTPWGVGVGYTIRAYHGRIKGSSIHIQTEGFDERVFRKMNR